MKEKLAALHPVLKELVLGILICGGVMQIGLIWFFSEKMLFTTGLWLGVLMSVLGAGHMYHTLDRALDMMEEDAQKQIRKGHALRFLLMVAVFLGVYFLKIGNIVAFFLGMLTLKFGAYLQPLIHQILTKKKKGG